MLIRFRPGVAYDSVLLKDGYKETTRRVWVVSGRKEQKGFVSQRRNGTAGARRGPVERPFDLGHGGSPQLRGAALSSRTRALAFARADSRGHERL